MLNRRAVALAATAAFLTTSSFAAEPPKGFRDLAWGATPSPALTKKAGHADEVEMHVRRGKKIPPFFGVPVFKEVYLFNKGKFYSATAWAQGRDNFRKLASVITEQYGEPSYGPDRLKWSWHGSLVTIELFYDERHFRSTVAFLNEETT